MEDLTPKSSKNKTLFDISLSNIFLNMSPQGNKIKNKQMGLLKLKTFTQRRKLSTNEKAAYREEIFANNISNDIQNITKKGLIFRIHILNNSTNQKEKDQQPIGKVQWAKELGDKPRKNILTNKL